VKPREEQFTETVRFGLPEKEKRRLLAAAAEARVPYSLLVREGLRRVLAEYERDGAVRFGEEGEG